MKSAFVSGHVLLPPGAIKDPESVGMCAQDFVVLRAQPMSLELALGNPNASTFEEENASRVLLSEGTII
jgi:centromere protein C